MWFSLSPSSIMQEADPSQVTVKNYYYISGSKGFPISFIFIQFSQKLLPNNTFLPQTQGLVPPIWEILDPPLHRKGHRKGHREGTWGHWSLRGIKIIMIGQTKEWSLLESDDCSLFCFLIVVFAGSEVFGSVLMWGSWVVLLGATFFACFIYKSQATEKEKRKYVELIRTGGAIGFVIEPRKFISFFGYIRVFL